MLPPNASPFALAATDTIDLKGNNITSDSFNSADPLFSTNGRYDPAKNKDNGDIATSRTGPGSINIGNAKIMGHVRTGTGTNTISIGPAGSVGDKAWVQGGTPGIKPGWCTTDWYVQSPDVVLPHAVWLPAMPGNYSIDGTNYQYFFWGDGDYVADSVSGSIFVRTNVSVRLKINGNVSLAAGEVIRVASTNERLIVYMAGATFSVGGSIESGGGKAGDILIYGLPSNTNIHLAGPFTGTIYAPAADLSLAGGGNTTNDFIGACLARTVTVDGQVAFHFDENLMPAIRPIVSLQLTDPSGPVQLHVRGNAGLRFALEASSNFVAWTRLLTNTPPFTYSDADSTNHVQRFYRAVYLP